MEQTTSRLRKTFRYPTEDSSEDFSLQALDEEEQESLIRTLHAEHTARNAQYVRILLFLPLTTSILYIPTLIYPPLALLSLLSVSSLLSTTYLLYTLPPGATSISILDNISVSSSSQPLSRSQRLQVDDGPILTYLPYLNMGLCALLGIAGMIGNREMWSGFGILPSGVYGVVVGAKWIMGSVDPEGELGGLRYRLKGA